MKVDEIRSQVADWSEADLIKLITVLYRKLPKEKKEEMDEVIQEGFGTGKKPVAKPKGAKVNLDELDGELDLFLEQARDGLYYYSNREVSKKERSNWRHKVNRMIKEYSSLPVEDVNYDYCTGRLCDIYDILGRASSFYTFASQDPYHTLGYESQSSFVEMLCDRFLKGKKDDVTLKKLIEVACNGDNDPETINCEIHWVLLDKLLPEVGGEHLEALAREVFEPTKEYYEARYKGRFSGFITEDEVEKRHKYFSRVWFIAAVIAQTDVLRAYEYIWEINPEDNPEVSLYCILDCYMPDPKDWVTVYEAAQKKGVKARDSLQKAYEKKLKEAGEE